MAEETAQKKIANIIRCINALAPDEARKLCQVIRSTEQGRKAYSAFLFGIVTPPKQQPEETEG